MLTVFDLGFVDGDGGSKPWLEYGRVDERERVLMVLERGFIGDVAYPLGERYDLTDLSGKVAVEGD